MDEEYSKKSTPPIQPSGKAIKNGKDPLDRWPGWESMPQFLTDMVSKQNFGNPDQKQFMEQVIRELYMTKSEQKNYLRPDPVPYNYRTNYQYLLESEPRLNANPTGLTIEQILSQDRHFHRTYVNNNVAAQIFARYGCTFYMEGKKWEIKHHLLTNYEWPKFSHTFRELGAIQVGPEGVKSTGYGWGAMYEIPFTTLDMASGGTYDPDYWSVFFLSQQMGIFGDERLFCGGTGRNTTNKGAPNLKGIVNCTSAATMISPSTDFGFSGGVADFNDWFSDALGSWYGNNVFGAGEAANVVVTTTGICAETTNHDSTVGDLKTAYQQLQDKWFTSGEMSAWYCSQNITSTALASMTVSTQEYVFMKMSPNYLRRTVVYPLQRKILSEKFKTYPDDIAFAYITGDILQVYDKNAIINSGSASHAKVQLKGWRMNGLFMDGQTTYQKAYQPPIR